MESRLPPFKKLHMEYRMSMTVLAILKAEHGIDFEAQRALNKSPRSSAYAVNDFPCDSKPYNALYDVPKRLPVFTKSAASKSFYCAGHYMVNFSSEYVYDFCPKLITLNRYQFVGPFKTKKEAQDFAKTIKE